MQETVPLRRPNISEELSDRVRDMIFSGQLAPGARVNEIQLAHSLGVSRTPLREGLNRLAAEGALCSIPRRGFFVRELTVEECRDIYPIRALLDPEALRLSGIPPAGEITRLEAVGEALGAARDVHEAIRLDDGWHRLLWGRCPNAALIELIEQFMLRTRRYELALMAEQANIARTVERKARIMGLLRGGDLTGACAALEECLASANRPIIAWLEGRG